MTIALFLCSGKNAKRERRAGKDDRGEPQEGGRSSKKRSLRATTEGGRTLQRVGRASKTKRRGSAKEETTRRGGKVKPNEVVGQEQVTTKVVLRIRFEMIKIYELFYQYIIDIWLPFL